MVKLDDITDRLHSLKKERRAHPRTPPGNAHLSGADFKFRSLARDHFSICVSIILGMALLLQLILIIILG